MLLKFSRFAKFMDLLILVAMFVTAIDISYPCDDYPARYFEFNPLSSYPPLVVFGNDDRTDVYAYQGDPYWIDVATNSVG